MIEQASAIHDIARSGKDPLAGPLRLGIIYTIGPYLLPELVRRCIDMHPQMPLMLQENFTVKLLEMLRTGEIDCAILAEPFLDTGSPSQSSTTSPSWPYLARTRWPRASPSAPRSSSARPCCCSATATASRDHVLEVCPEFARFSADADGLRRSFEGSSLETIKHMVASGMASPCCRSSPSARCARRQCLPPALRPLQRPRAHAPRGAGLAAQLYAL